MKVAVIDLKMFHISEKSSSNCETITYNFLIHIKYILIHLD